MAELKNTALGDMIPEKVDSVEPGSNGNIALSAVRYVAQSLDSGGMEQAKANVGVFYGTCSTAGGTAAKVVTCSKFASRHLVAGTVLRVKFTYANSSQTSITLNVNSTGAKTVSQDGLPTGALNAAWGSNDVVAFVYDGTYWRIDNSATAVRFSPQALTDEQKSQARTNIGALPASSVVAPSPSATVGQAADAKATGDALAERPTKSQLDEGWWSEWEFSGLPEGGVVDSMEWSEAANCWIISISIPTVVGSSSSSSYGNGGEYSSSVQFDGVDIGPYLLNVTATRRRVAAPVPTRPSDIGAYAKPSGGIPKSDLASGVQTSLGKADTAVQPEAGKGLFSGSYNDLSNKPTIPAAQVQANWNETSTSSKAYINNKPTNLSQFTNDSGFITGYTETDPTVPAWAKASSKPSYNFSEIGSKPTSISGYGITDAKIANGVITLGSNTITPLTSYTETDPTVPAWAKASSKPSYNYSEIGNRPSLAGNTYDFDFNSDIVMAVADIVRALGGTVVNDPTSN